MKSKTTKPKKVIVFLDGVDWDHEIGEAPDGNTVYPSLDSLKEYNRCWEGCGIVQCEITFKKRIAEYNWEKMSEGSTTYTAKDLENNRDILRLESAQKHLEYLEERVTKQKHKIVELKVNLKGKK